MDWRRGQIKAHCMKNHILKAVLWLSTISLWANYVRVCIDEGWEVVGRREGPRKRSKSRKDIANVDCSGQEGWSKLDSPASFLFHSFSRREQLSSHLDPHIEQIWFADHTRNTLNTIHQPIHTELNLKSSRESMGENNPTFDPQYRLESHWIRRHSILQP